MDSTLLKGGSIETHPASLKDYYIKFRNELIMPLGLRNQIILVFS